MLLHDRLDGGLRVATIIELAEAVGWTLPTTDGGDVQARFTRGAETADLLQYLATFEHTLAVMQTADHVERIAHEAHVELVEACDAAVRRATDLVCGPLVQYVLDHRIHLEMAPTCNVQSERCRASPSTPSDRSCDAGFNVGYNTDNRLMSNVMPSSELHAVATAHDLTTAEIERLATNAMMSSFAPMDVRRRIVAELIVPGY